MKRVQSILVPPIRITKQVGRLDFKTYFVRMPERHLAAAPGANLLFTVAACVTDAVCEFRLHAQTARRVQVDATDLVLFGPLAQRLLQYLNFFLLAAGRTHFANGVGGIVFACMCVFVISYVHMCVGYAMSSTGLNAISTTKRSSKGVLSAEFGKLLMGYAYQMYIPNIVIVYRVKHVFLHPSH